MTDDVLAPLRGTRFTKMTGSGNDFVFFDGRHVDANAIAAPAVVRALCDRHDGIGADGVVVLTPRATDGSIALRYYNSDGSLGELCGNATLCSTAQSVRLGMADARAVRLLTDAGVVDARLADGLPEIDVAAAQDVRRSLPALAAEAGAARAGFALVGVPHLVLLLREPSAGHDLGADAAAAAAAAAGADGAGITALGEVDVSRDGPPLRRHASLGPAGANVNWVAWDDRNARWAYRTFERGVEGETLACGTGAIAIAVLLVAWGLAASPVSLTTRSGRVLEVTITGNAESAVTASATERASATESSARTVAAPGQRLRGEGRVVFDGELR